MEKARLPRDAELFIQAAGMSPDQIPYTLSTLRDEWEEVCESVCISGLSASQREGALAALDGAYERIHRILHQTVEA